MFEKNTTGTKPEGGKKASVISPAKIAKGGETTTIGSSINIKGELSGGNDLIIQGKVEGTIKLQNNSVSVGEQGHIQADVFAKSITVQGELYGDLHGTEKVTISRSGRVKGNIIAPRVVLEDGASFKGSIDMENKPVASNSSAEIENTPKKASIA
ncbi:MAG: polymer-forming cytoskeletal protein [Pseudomonadota bacterium]